MTQDYVIGPGDELRVQMWGQVNEQGTFVVDRTGSISVPQVGSIHVAGLKFSQITEFLRGATGADLSQLRFECEPGTVAFDPGVCGGRGAPAGELHHRVDEHAAECALRFGRPLAQGSLRDIQVQRGGQTVVHFDLYDLLLHGDKSKDVALAPGDVIFIPPVGPQVALLGSVNNPAIYELRGETTPEQLVALGGGRTSAAAGSQLRLQRIYEHSLLSMVDVGSAQATTMPLQNGDLVAVGSITDRFKDAVALRGNVANPGRYVWHPGMRITDLIPTKTHL